MKLCPPRIVTLAAYIWDDDTDARDFLNTPHPLLGDQTPADAAATEAGAHQVEKILWSLYYGLAV